MKEKKPKQKYEGKEAARITIQMPGLMTKRGRKDIAKWLRNHADWLIEHGDEYTHGRFTGRFFYQPES